MITEWQKRYTEWYLKTLHYRYQWARWLSRKEIEKRCKEKWYNKDTLEVILSLNSLLKCNRGNNFLIEIAKSRRCLSTAPILNKQINYGKYIRFFVGVAYGNVLTDH